MNFLITGYPRSRTAWMAALCNTVPDAICYHEPIAQKLDWRALWYQTLPQYVGIADPAFALLNIEKDLLKFNPLVLWIDRDRNNVENSLREIGFGDTGVCEEINQKRGSFFSHFNLKRVSFKSLDDRQVVYESLRFLMPEAEIDIVKIDQFLRLNIQVQPEVTMHEVLY